MTRKMEFYRRGDKVLRGAGRSGGARHLLCLRSPAVARGYVGRDFGELSRAAVLVVVLVLDSELNEVMEYRSFGLLRFLQITSRGRGVGSALRA